MRTAVPSSGRAVAVAQSDTFISPVNGWVKSQNDLVPRQYTAVKSTNTYPTLRGSRVRGGSVKTATIAGAVKTIMPYEVGSGAKMFAADDGNIYDITTVADPDVAPTPDVTGQSSGEYSTVIHTNAGGSFLLAFNGVDLHQVYDGTSWAANTPAMTFSGSISDSTGISSAWSYKNRLFMIEKNSLNAHYLSVDSIAGAASVLSLAGVFNKGGTLAFGTTWSTSAGDGLADRCVFVSTRGQVAVYEGSNPGDPTDWQLVGVYDVGQPVGERATMSVGNDVIIGTNEGIIPLSQAVSKDISVLTLASLSVDIEDEWRDVINVRGKGFGWQFTKWSELNLALISIPSLTGQPDRQFVVHLLTGKWSDFEGWDVQCSAVLGTDLYYGNAAGQVLIADQSGTDNGDPYYVTIAHAFQVFKKPNRIKEAQMMRATFRASTPFIPKYSVSSNFVLTPPNFPNAAIDPANDDLWDVGLWDVAEWDASGTFMLISTWKSVYGTGYSLSPVIQITISSAAKPDIEHVSTDLEYNIGAKVVR
jgi:hypothetical protein